MAKGSRLPGTEGVRVGVTPIVFTFLSMGTGEPDTSKVCAAGRGAASLTQSRGVRRETPGSSTYLRAKAGGDKSMSEKRESLEGVYSAVPQDPRDMVKAGLPESQSPVVELYTRRDHAWLRRHHERADKLSRCVLFA